MSGEFSWVQFNHIYNISSLVVRHFLLPCELDWFHTVWEGMREGRVVLCVGCGGVGVEGGGGLCVCVCVCVRVCTCIC